MAARPDRGVLLTLGAVLLAGALAGVATQGLVYAAIAIVGAAYVAFVITFGARATGIACMIAAFAAAPMYRGIEALTGGVPPTDVFLFAAIVHLAPTFLRHRLQLPTVYLVGLLVMAVCSLVAVMVTGDVFNNAFHAVQWLFFIGVLPIVVAWWRPDRRIVRWLCWAYLGGHVASTATALAEGAVTSNRYDGLTHHPNAFGLAGVVAIAIVLHLFREHKDVATRLVLAGVVAISLFSITLSGSRAAIVVLVALILLVPIVERSAPILVALAGAAALGVLSLPLIVDVSGDQSAIGRLAGAGTAAASDASRDNAFELGWQRLWESPILGSGFKEIELIHNIYLETAVAIGVFGFVGYLMVLFALARPLFSHHPQRRLCYLVWVFIGVAPTFPGLWDRTVWVPASLAALAMLAPEMRNAPADREVRPARTPSVPVQRRVSPGRA